MLSFPLIVLLSIATCAAVLLTLSRVISPRLIVRHSAIVDVLFTIMCFKVFAGTLGGTLVAVLAGLFMAIILTVAKSYWTWAYEHGYVNQPLKDPKPVKATPMTREEATHRFHSGLHSNVVQFTNKFKKAA